MEGEGWERRGLWGGMGDRRPPSFGLLAEEDLA